MTESLREGLFVEPKSTFGLKLIATISALAVTIAVLVGYAFLRQRHVNNAAAQPSSSQNSPEPKKSPKALILVDEATLKANKTIVGGSVKNTSTETLRQVAVELELKRRKDGSAEKRLIGLVPSQLEPAQEGRYSLELISQEYGSARLVGLKSGTDATSIAYVSGPGQKRPPERLESKTVIVDRPSTSKHGEFLNSPDNPARVP